MNIALLTAAGTGSRMGQDIPKQFLHIYDKPLIIYTMQAFQENPQIDAIEVVCLDGWHDLLWSYAKQFNITKLKWVVSGGSSGQESIHNGLENLKNICSDNDIIMIHDGNRALVSQDIITNNIICCKAYGNAITFIPCNEVVVFTEGGEGSPKNISREKIKRTQTPHTFFYKDLRELHKKAEENNITNSVASCELMIEFGRKIYFVAGSEKNIKLTTTDDLEIFKALLKAKNADWIK